VVTGWPTAAASFALAPLAVALVSRVHRHRRVAHREPSQPAGSRRDCCTCPEPWWSRYPSYCGPPGSPSADCCGKLASAPGGGCGRPIPTPRCPRTT